MLNPIKNKPETLAIPDSLAKTSRRRRALPQKRHRVRRLSTLELLETRVLLAADVATQALVDAGFFGNAYAEQSLIDFHGPDLRGKDGPLARLDLPLISLFHEYNHFVASETPADFQSSNRLVRTLEDRVVVDLVASPNAVNSNSREGAEQDWGTAALAHQLQNLGSQITGSWGPMVSALVPIPSLPEVAGLSALRFASASMNSSNVGRVTSQGDAAMRSNLARSTNETGGEGITIGVISDSYNSQGGAAADVASGDLPTSVQVLADDGFSDEGRAMMQLIHDVAPGASQAFHTANFGQAGFANGILRLAEEAHADVIVDDIIYFAEPFFQDGVIAQAVDQVVADGTAYFSSAGNQARAAYEGEFRNSGLQDPLTLGIQHDFDPGPGVDVLQQITVPVGQGFILILQWDSPFFSVSPQSGGSTNDLDIVVYDSTGTIPLNGSFEFNIGGDAVEGFQFFNPGGFGETFNISISNVSGPDAGYLKYALFPDAGVRIDEFDTQSGTTYGHAFAAGAESVGAAFYFETPEFGFDPAVIEPFSSAGGSPDGVITPILFDTAGNRLATPEIRANKPGIVGPDGTNTTFFIPGLDVEGDGFPNFFGTSASAPHAAAVAALMLAAAGGPGSLTPTEIYSTLRTTALDMDDPDTAGFDVGFDLATGFGFIDAEAAVAAVALPPPPVVLFPVPLTPVKPAGSLVYTGNIRRLIDYVDDTDGYEITVDPGQTLSVILESEPTLRASVVVSDSNGNELATASATTFGADIFTQPLRVPGAIAGDDAPTTYIVTVAGQDGSLGGYNLRLILNAALETESHGGLTNGDLQSAQSLESSFIALNGSTLNTGPQRGAVMGTLGVSTVSTLLYADFETGLQGFSIDNDSLPDPSFYLPGLWHLSSGRGEQPGHSQSTSLYYGLGEGPQGGGTYSQGRLNPSFGAILSPAIALPDTDQRLVLDFNHVLQTRVFPSDVDIAAVEINSGSGWTRLQRFDRVSEGTGWHNSGNVDLTDYAGETVALRWVFDTFRGPRDRAAEGWYIDDVRIREVSPNDFYSFDLTAGQSVTVGLNNLAAGNATFSLLSPAGQTIALASTDATTNLNSVISNYFVTTSGTYYVKVHGESEAVYNLVVTRNADFDTENNHDRSHAQQILTPEVGGKRWVLGELETPVSETLTFDELPFQSVDGLHFKGITFDFKVAGFDAFDASYGAFGPGTTTYTQDPSLEGTSQGILTLDFDQPITHLQFGLAMSATFAVPDAATITLFDANSNVIDTFTIGITPGSFVFASGLFQYSGAAATRAILDFNEFATSRFIIDNLSYEGAPTTDFYEVSGLRNQTLEFETLTPGDLSGEFRNGLDSLLRLYDATGRLLASNDNGGADGRNAKLSYTVPGLPRGIREIVASTTGARFYLEVASGASNGISHGEYILSAKTATTVPSLYEVQRIEPTNGQRIRGPLSEVRIDFDDVFLVSTLQASDMRVDGIAASTVRIIDGDSVVFGFEQEFEHGHHVVRLEKGALLDVQGAQLQGFASAFFVDSTPPIVLSTSPNLNDVVAEGPQTITVTFSESMDTLPVDIFDLPLYGKFNFVFPAGLSWNADSTILTIQYDFVPEDNYQLNLFGSDFFLQDLVGNDLDGDLDQLEGGTYLLTFDVDADTRMVPVPLIPVGPVGSLIYQSFPPAFGVLTAKNDIDEWTIELDAGQTVSVLVDTDFDLQGKLEFIAPDGSVLATEVSQAPGQQTLLQTVAVDTFGEYRLRVAADADFSQGRYWFVLTLNAALELENLGGPSNGETASAQSIDASFISLGGQADRGAVLGQTDGPGNYTANAATAFQFVDISTTGTPILQGSDDGSHFLSSLDLAGFQFSFYGRAAESLSISANGFIELYFADGNGVINVLARDLVVFGNPDASVYWQIMGADDEQQMIIQWDHVGFFGFADADPITFQVILNEQDGSFLFNYLDLQTNYSFLDEGIGANVGGYAYFYATGEYISFNLETFDAPNQFVGSGRSTLLTANPPQADYFSFELHDGRSTTLAFTALESLNGAVLQIRNAADQILAEAVAGADNLTLVISDFTAPSAGEYFAVVSGSSVRSYSLVVTRGATFELEPNDAIAEAQTIDLLGSPAVLGYANGALPAEIGLVANDATKTVTVFDAVTDTILATIQIPTSAPAFGDIEIARGRKLAFVTDFFGAVWIIELSSTPTLASGNNPIFVSNNAEDLAITADERYLMVSDGSNVQPLVVIDIESRTQIGTFDPASDHNSIAVTADGSVLVTSSRNTEVRRFTIDSSGTLADTGELLDIGGPVNVYAAPVGPTGVVIRFRTVSSFTVAGLTLISSQTNPHTPSNYQSAVFSPDGTRLYVRADGAGNSGFIDVWGYDPITGAFSAAPLYTISGIDNDPAGSLPDRINVFFGIDQIDLSEDGSKLYVPQNSSVKVYDALTGDLLSEFSDHANSFSTGVKLTTIEPDTDKFQFTVSFIGQAIDITTLTPGGGPGQFENILDPKLTVIDPTGTVVFSDDNSSSDSRNAFIRFVAETTGTFTIVISAADRNPGEYVLLLSSQSGGLAENAFSSYPTAPLNAAPQADTSIRTTQSTIQHVQREMAVDQIMRFDIHTTFEDPTERMRKMRDSVFALWESRQASGDASWRKSKLRTSLTPDNITVFKGLE